MYDEAHLSTNHLHSEGILVCKKNADGNFEFEDGVDKREDKGIFIRPDGTVFRG